MLMEKTVLDFISTSKKSLCEYFYQASEGKELKDVYPTFFDNTKYCKNVTKITKNELDTNISNNYENNIPLKIRKDFGQFYTRNSKIIENIISHIDVMSGKILEPSCGSGLFLIKIIEKIKESSKNKLSSEQFVNYVVKNIYGNDVDKEVLEIAELNIIKSLIDDIVSAKKENNKYKMERVKLSCNDFLEKGHFQDFSIVIGNPPFVTMYGKRSRNMTEEKRKVYNSFNFVQNKKGNNKFNIAMFFVENGMEALAQNGNLIYIMDISFFETAYIDLRKYILNNFAIKYICSGLQEFEDVASGQIIINIEKTRQQKTTTWQDCENNEIYQIDQAAWNVSPKYKIAKPLQQTDENIIRKIEQHETLEKHFPNKCLRTCCALTGKTEEFIVDPAKETKFLVFPYIEGSKGLDCKFGQLQHQRYIKYDYDLQIKLSDEFKAELTELGVKNKKRVTLGDKDVYLSPKLFIRQSANELIATYSEKPYAANNSIYVLSNKDNSDKTKDLLKYTCGILNSDLMTFYALTKKIIRAEKGKTPQIKTSDLKQVRIPYDSDPNKKELIKIVENLQKDPKNVSFITALNDHVYNLFGITKQEKENISKTIS